MTVLQALVLGVVQGLTEFLPVSSSGHLVIIPSILGWGEPGVAFSIALHLGTLIALIIYFWSDISAVSRATFWSTLGRRIDDPWARLGWKVVLATIPAALAGFLFHGFFEKFFSQPFDVAFLLVVTGAILLIGEAVGQQTRELKRLSLQAAIGIGLFQIASILPGISRSGTTMSAGLIFGLKRDAAARFAFLLGVPIIAGAVAYEAVRFFRQPDGTTILLFLVGTASAAATGLIAIHTLLTYVERRGLYVFAAYCIAFGTMAMVYALVLK